MLSIRPDAASCDGLPCQVCLLFYYAFEHIEGKLTGTGLFRLTSLPPISQTSYTATSMSARMVTH